MVCAIANYILHQLDKDRKHMANLFRAVGVINEPLPNQQAARIGLIKVLLKLKTGAGLTFLAARRVKAGLALLPRHACMPPAIDLAAVPERVKVAFKTVTDIDHRLVTGAQRGIAGG
jgi:hypothetical protein